MTKKKYILSAYLISSIVLGLGLAIWRTILILRFYDPYAKEFSLEAGGYLSTIGYVTFGILILMVSAAFFLRKTSYDTIEASASQFSVFTSSFSGFMYFAIAILILIYYRESIFAESAHMFFSSFQVIALFMMFPAAGYFLLNSSAETIGAKAKIALSFCPTLWTLFYLISSYANPAYTYSDPNRLFCNVSLIAVLLFYLYETRRNAIGPQNSVHFVFGLIAIVCTLVYVVPTTLLTAFWEIELTTNTIFEAVEIGAVFYIISMLVLMLRHMKAPAQTETIKEEKTEN